MRAQRAQVAGNQFAPIAPERDAAGITAQEFADSLFEYEYCGECHGDTQDHLFVISPFGQWFAWCKREHVENCKVCK